MPSADTRGWVLECAAFENVRRLKELTLIPLEYPALPQIASMKEAMLHDDQDAFTVRVASMAEGAMADASSRDIKVDSFSVSARGKTLLENTSLTIVAGRRYGLVGPNGKGKSTLLKLIGWRKLPVPDYIDVLMVEQEVVGDGTPALQAVVAADVELMQLRTEEAELKEKIEAAEKAGGEADDSVDEASVRLGEVYERLTELGSGGAEARAAKILHGLGFTEAMQGRPTQSFSGGWRMRISLARALYIQPTLLLLDGGRSLPCPYPFPYSDECTPL